MLSLQLRRPRTYVVSSGGDRGAVYAIVTLLVMQREESTGLLTLDWVSSIPAHHGTGCLVHREVEVCNWSRIFFPCSLSLCMLGRRGAEGLFLGHAFFSPPRSRTKARDYARPCRNYETSALTSKTTRLTAGSAPGLSLTACWAEPASQSSVTFALHDVFI